MQAASPAATRRTREQFNPHPGGEEQLACPIPDCADTDHLELIYDAKVYTPAEVYRITGVTFPEVDEDRDAEQTSTTAGERTLAGVRCGSCRWSYIGPDPLSRLQ